MHGLSSIERSLELLGDPGKLIIYCKLQVYPSLSQSFVFGISAEHARKQMGAPRMPEPAPPAYVSTLLGIKKPLIYCKIHGLGIIEWSPGAPPRPGKVNNIL